MLWVIGVDEAGRGPLAGPISVGVVAMPINQHKWKFWKGLKDSKQLSESQRGIWFAEICRTSDVLHSVAMVGTEMIDRDGISRAAALATERSLSKLSAKMKVNTKDAEVLLDWGLSAPNKWKQKQFVKGDERFPVIALASIVAKVTRDLHMKNLARRLPGYGFEAHKGYGTKAHYEAIRKHGLCPEHRKTFLSKICK